MRHITAAGLLVEDHPSTRKPHALRKGGRRGEPHVRRYFNLLRRNDETLLTASASATLSKNLCLDHDRFMGVVQVRVPQFFAYWYFSQCFASLPCYNVVSEQISHD